MGGGRRKPPQANRVERSWPGERVARGDETRGAGDNTTLNCGPSKKLMLQPSKVDGHQPMATPSAGSGTTRRFLHDASIDQGE